MRNLKKKTVKHNDNTKEGKIDTQEEITIINV